MEIPALINPCEVVALEKSITFDVHTELTAAVVYNTDDHVEEELVAAERAVTEEQALYVFTDKHKLVQVMRNLVTNSIKFTPPRKSVSLYTKQLPEVEASPSIRSGGIIAKSWRRWIN